MKLPEKINNFFARIKTGRALSFGLMALFAVLSLSSLFLSPRLYQSNIREGEVALKDVYAPYDFTYEWGTSSAGVEPLLRRVWSIRKGEIVVEKGKRISPRDIAKFSQLRSFIKPGKPPVFLFGAVLLLVLLGLVAFIYTARARGKEFMKNTKEVAITLLAMFYIIFVSDFVMSSPQTSYFIPMASMGMLISLLVGFELAFLGSVLMSVLISMLLGGGIELCMVMIVESAVGIYAVSNIRRRSGIIIAGLLVGAAKFAAIGCVGLINGTDVDLFILDGLWGLVSGVFSAFLVMGFLPILEHVFDVSTNISLLELSDMNHPLLKELAVEAPGTYHHSMMVGNLAEAACDAVGANSLLARVGSYYHDIGKMSMAEYYSENEMFTSSKHEKLTPQMSALIISKHVKEGVELARKHKLNSAIIDFISQHHGDGIIVYFYQKAIEKAAPDEIVEESGFRYPGPRPDTKERAIVLLADSVEASSRSLEDPTPASIRNLVKKIINNKFIDGQLEACDLTLKDMQKIVDSFTRVLMGIFHTRLKYPEEIKKPGEEAANGGKSLQQKSKQKKKD